MKKLLLILLPGGIVLAVITGLVDLFLSLATGNDDVDALRWPLIYGLIVTLKPIVPADWSDALAQGRALMLVAIAENSIGKVGDTDPSLAPGGPSISPWQIELVNAVARGYVDPGTSRTDYAAIDTQSFPASYQWAANAVDFFNSNVWIHANGTVSTALAVWNGGPRGPGNSQAQTYASRGIAAAPAGWAVS